MNNFNGNQHWQRAQRPNDANQLPPHVQTQHNQYPPMTNRVYPAQHNNHNNYHYEYKSHANPHGNDTHSHHRHNAPPYNNAWNMNHPNHYHHHQPPPHHHHYPQYNNNNRGYHHCAFRQNRTPSRNQRQRNNFNPNQHKQYRNTHNNTRWRSREMSHNNRRPPRQRYNNHNHRNNHRQNRSNSNSNNRSGRRSIRKSPPPAAVLPPAPRRSPPPPPDNDDNDVDNEEDINNDNEDDHDNDDIDTGFDDIVSSIPFESFLMQFLVNEEHIISGFDNILSLTNFAQINNVANRLPTRVVSATEILSKKKCLICYEAYKEKEIVKTLPCIHYFHTQCIDPWLESHDTCPECRHSIIDNDIET